MVQTLESLLQQKAIHHHEYGQAELKVVTEERQSMQLQADMERNEKIMSEARETLVTRIHTPAQRNPSRS